MKARSQIKPNQAEIQAKSSRNPKRSQPKASRNPGKVLVNESQIKPKPSRSSSRKPAEGLRSQPAGARSQPSPDRRESAVTADHQAGFLDSKLLNCHTMSTGPLAGTRPGYLARDSGRAAKRLGCTRGYKDECANLNLVT